MNYKPFEITIVGAGAIGGVIGAYLMKGGYDVLFLDVNEEHIQKMKNEGLNIKANNENFSVPVNAMTIEEFKNKNLTLNVVLLAVKAQHTKDAIKSISEFIEDDGYVVSCQNGLNEEIIVEEIGRKRTIGSFVNLFADYIEPGVIQYGGVGSVYIGELSGENSTRINNLKKVLSSWGDAKITNNISGYLWSKLAYGAILTASATTNITIADFIESKKYRPLIIALGTEVLQVAHSMKIKPEFFDDWEPQYLYPTLDTVKLEEQFEVLVSRLRGYTKTRTGIWRDLAVHQRKTEVPQQLNPIIKQGKSLGFDMILLEKLLEIIIEIENGEREMDEKNLDELVSLL